MSKNTTDILEVLRGLRGETKTAEEEPENKEQPEELETKEAEEEETVEAVGNLSEDDLNKLADIISNRVKSTSESTGSSKVDGLVDKLNKEAADMSVAQEKIVTAVFNETCVDGEGYGSDEILKMASDEDSIVPHLIDCVYKYAAEADSLLYNEYGDEYNEDDVIKMASVLISSFEDPFGLTQMQEAAEEEKVAENEEEDSLDKMAREVLANLSKEDDADTVREVMVDAIKEKIRSINKG